MVIAHNTSAINTFNQMNKVSKDSNKSMEKLSSGYKINRAADDAAGLSISEKMRSQIRGLNKAGENVEQSVSMIQTAEGALNESHAILQRMRELAVQSANDTNAGSDREALQSEINELTCEINRIANTTEFNGMKILNGSKVKLSDTENIFVANEGDINLGSFNGVINTAKLELSDPITFDGTKTYNNINYKSIKAVEGVNLITISKKDGRLFVNAHIESDNGLYSEDITDYELFRSSNGDYKFNTNGIQFSLTQKSVEKFLNQGSDSDKTVIDLYKAGTFAMPAGYTSGYVTGKQVKDIYYEWAKTAGSGRTICFNYGSDFFYLNPTGTTSSGKSIDEVFSEIPDNAIFSEQGVDEARDFHYHSINNKFAGVDITQKPIQITNYYEGDSSIYGNISNFHVTSYKTGDAQNRLDYDKVEIEFSNANDANFTFKEGKLLYRKVESTTVPLTVINFDDYIKVNPDGTYSLLPGANLYKEDKSTLITEADLADYIDGHSADTGSLNVKFYNGSDVLISDTIEMNGLGKISTDQTFTYSANGISFDYTLNEMFSYTDKIHAIVDIDEKLGIHLDTKSQLSFDNSVYFQVGANSNQFINTEFSDMRANKLGLTGTGENYTSDRTVTNGTDAKRIECALNISDRLGAENAISAIDNAINIVSNERSKYGAIQNRLEYTMNNLNTTAENMTNAESTIRDVDMAEEMMTQTKSNILQQASQAMLTQAMQRPQQVLNLLK